MRGIGYTIDQQYLALAAMTIAAGLLGHSLVGLLQVLQRLTHAAQIQVLVDAEHLLGHGVHVGVAGAHLVDDLVDVILQLGGPCPARRATDQLVELLEQLGMTP